MDESKSAVADAATVVVRKQYKSTENEGPIEEQDELIEVQVFVVKPAVVRFGIGATINMGNYESARVDVEVTVPCYKEEVDDAYEFARKWAKTRLEAEAEVITKKKALF